MVSHEELLAVGNHGGVNSVGDWCPERTAEEDECQWRPESVGDEADDSISEIDFLVDRAIRSECHSDQGEVDENKVEGGHEVEEDGPHAAEHVLLQFGVSLVECRAEGSSWFEGYNLTT